MVKSGLGVTGVIAASHVALENRLKQEFADVVQREKELHMKDLGAQLSDPKIGMKKYWTILKKLMNEKVSTIVPPVFLDGRYITDIKEKCEKRLINI